MAKHVMVMNNNEIGDLEAMALGKLTFTFLVWVLKVLERLDEL